MSDVALTKKHMYTCEKSPHFKLRLIDGPPEVYAQFENGVFTTEDNLHAEALDLALATRPAVSMLIKKVNWARAEAVVAHALEQKGLQSGTVKGAVTAFALSARKAAALEEDTKTNLANAGLDTAAAAKVLDELKAQGLTTTVKTDAEIIAAQAEADDANPQKPTEAEVANINKLKFGTTAKTA